MKNLLKKFIVAIGLLVLFTAAANAQWKQGQRLWGGNIAALAVNGNNTFAASYGGVFLMFILLW
jgi:hypothetical protein